MADHPVLLLHGLWMHAPVMHWFAGQLRRHGYSVYTPGYFSLLDSTDQATARIARALDRLGQAHIVGHSLGGLIGLQAVLDRQGFQGRVVCMGTPVAGSGAATAIHMRAPRMQALVGPHMPLLTHGVGELPAGIQAGMIAGRTPRGLGGMLARFEGEHDGTVAVEETRQPALTDHVVIDASHSGLMFSSVAVAQCAQFLQQGRFLRASPRV